MASPSQSFILFSSFSSLHFRLPTRKAQVRNSVFRRETELLVKESPAYREKGEGGKRGQGNVAEKWVRKASLEAKVLGN